jgi:hypothetical protein
VIAKDFKHSKDLSLQNAITALTHLSLSVKFQTVKALKGFSLLTVTSLKAFNVSVVVMLDAQNFTIFVSFLVEKLELLKKLRRSDYQTIA